MVRPAVSIMEVLDFLSSPLSNKKPPVLNRGFLVAPATRLGGAAAGFRGCYRTHRLIALLIKV
jgi:hypothetical protein